MKLDGHIIGEDISGGTVADSTPTSRASPTASNKDITIAFAPASAAHDSELVSAVVSLVNKAFADVESDIFHPGYQRTSAAEIATFINHGRLVLAYLNTRPSEESSVTESRSTQQLVIGCVHVKQLSPTLGDFGMLASDARHRGGGLGRELVLFAENHCRKMGCTTMQLELLVPTSFEHAVKTRMQAWYLRMGYQVVKLGSFQDEYPALAPLLTGPVNYKIFEKGFTSDA